MDDEDLIQEYFENQIKCVKELEKNSTSIKKILNILLQARENKNKIFLFGNGGSSSTASHFTSDLLKTSIIKDEKRFKAYCLSDNVPVLLAWANDSSYESIFENQLENFLEKDDVVIGISGSGNSSNVIQAIEYANKMSAKTIGLTGMGGGKLAQIAKTNLIIESKDMLTIETVHLLVCHLLTTLIRAKGEPLFSY